MLVTLYLGIIGGGTYSCQAIGFSAFVGGLLGAQFAGRRIGLGLRSIFKSASISGTRVLEGEVIGSGLASYYICGAKFSFSIGFGLATGLSF